MAGCLSMRMKRKQLEEVNHDFSDFSLSSPATKIRRLDAELPPIMEEEDTDAQLVLPENEVGGSCPVMEELPTMPQPEDRAIVLFKPMGKPLLQSPSNFSLSVSSDIILGFKNQIYWSSQSNSAKLAEDEAARQGSNTRETNECLAVVPWVPTQILLTSGTKVPQTEVSEVKESEDMGATTMDIEETAVTEQGCELSGMSGGLHQWQQQHCMIPQLSQNPSTPIVWFR